MSDDQNDFAKQPVWRRYLRMVRANPKADLDDELRDHFESSVEGLIARGASPEEARAEAARRFGDVSRVRRQVQRLDSDHHARTARRATLETVVYDLRHAARGLKRSPGFTTVAAVSIALGIAANTTVFSVVNAVLFRPIPGAHAQRLQRVYVNHHSPFDWHDLSWFRANAKSFDHFFGERYGVMAFHATPGADAERIQTSYVTHGFFPALGVQMALGRTFDVDESAHANDEAVAVLSYRFWQRRFAGDSAVIGRRIVVGDHELTIVGVAGPDFRSSVIMWAPDVLMPFAIAPVLTGQSIDNFGGSFYTTARLADGVTTDQAGAELRGLMTRLARTDSVRYEGMTVRLDNVEGVNAEMRGGVTAGSVFMMAMVLMVLLTACANVANLLLGRAAARRTEMGVRLAIGASRGRLVGQLLTESLLLAALGTALGFAMAFVITRVLPAGLPPEAGIDSRYFTPDLRVVLFTIALCVMTTLLFGAVPSFRAASPDLVGMLKGDALTGRRKRRGILVVVQTAMCVVLLAVASLFLRGLSSARNVDPGFNASNVIDASIDLNLLPNRKDRPEMFARILEDAAHLPGVESSTLAAVVPLSGSNMETVVAPEGFTAPNRHDYPHVYFNVVGPRFFSTLRTPIARGREFLESDGPASSRVAMLNETAARRLWLNGDALGKYMHWGSPDGPLVQIVGITRDANYVMPGESPKATVYVPFAQEQRGEMTLQLRTTADLATTRRGIWSLLHAVAPTLPPPPVARMTDDMSITLLPVRLGALLVGAFGMIALILASAGIYGVAAYSVASRTREIGVRAALGASRARLLRMVLWENGRRVIVGAVIGLGATIAVGVGLSKVLYGVHAVDPLVIVTVAAVIAAVALLATLVPARRAARADPVVAMRSE